MPRGRAGCLVVHEADVLEGFAAVLAPGDATRRPVPLAAACGMCDGITRVTGLGQHTRPTTDTQCDVAETFAMDVPQDTGPRW